MRQICRVVPEAIPEHRPYAGIVPKERRCTYLPLPNSPRAHSPGQVHRSQQMVVESERGEIVYQPFVQV